MLQRLIMKLDDTYAAVPNINVGDALHGVIMEHLDPGDVEKLHSQNVNPYSQYIESRREGLFWIIQTLTPEAGELIVEPFMRENFTGFHLKRLNKNFAIAEKHLYKQSMDDLVKKFYFNKSDRFFRVRFLTPTAFKSGGEYIFHPDLRLVFGSLMRKHSFICESNGEEDSETLNSLVANTKIVRYNLKSVYNEIERSHLPAFCGMIVIKASGPQPLINYLNFLLRFGEYCGAGIKCALGMGAMKIIDKPDSQSKGGDTSDV